MAAKVKGHAAKRTEKIRQKSATLSIHFVQKVAHTFPWEPPLSPKRHIRHRNVPFMAEIW